MFQAASERRPSGVLHSKFQSTDAMSLDSNRVITRSCNQRCTHPEPQHCHGATRDWQVTNRATIEHCFSRARAILV